MNKPEVRARLLAVVPELTAPADRLGQVRRQADRRRVKRLLMATLATGLALTAFVGALNLLSPAGAGGTFANDPDLATSASTPGPSPSRSGPRPGLTGSGIPSTGRGSYAANDLVGRDRCPATLDLGGPLGVDVVPPGSGSDEVSEVTVCRYRHEAFDMSVGKAIRLAGPRQADPASVARALVPILNPPPSNWNSEGCRMPSPSRNVTVDIVYVVGADGSATVHSLTRITCANPWPADPAIKLRAAVDATMGPPY